MKKIEFQANKNVISRQLKMARVQADMSQSELATKLQLLNVHMDQQMISKIENNTRIVTDYELACICYILKAEITDMLADCYSLLKKME